MVRPAGGARAAGTRLSDAPASAMRALVARLFGNDAPDVLHALHALVDELEARPYLGVVDARLSPDLEAAVSLRVHLANRFGRARLMDAADADALRAVAETVAEEEQRLRALASDVERRRVDARRMLTPEPGDPAPRLERVAALLRSFDDERLAGRPPEAWWAQKRTQYTRFLRAYRDMPRFLARRRAVRARLPERLRRDVVAMETFSAIEQVGPVLDTFAFGGQGQLFRPGATAVADFAFLYMQMADELVDGIFHRLGEPRTRALLRDARATETRIPLAELDDAQIRAAGIDPGASLPKYRTTFGAHLAQIRALEVAMLGALEAHLPGAREAITEELYAFLHHCFQTFEDELDLAAFAGETPLDRLPLSATQWHFHRKNHEVMARFVALRARALGLDPNRHAAALFRWGQVLANFQIFDDLKDIPVDLHRQPSWVLQLAHAEAPEERAHLDARFDGRDDGLRAGEIPEVSLLAPRTTLTSLALARLIAAAMDDPVLDYVLDYRWRRNWLVRARNFNREEAASASPRPGATCGDALLDRFAMQMVETRDLGVALIADGDASFDLFLAYHLDLLAFDDAGPVFRAALPSRDRVYCYGTLRTAMDPRDKRDLLARVLRARPRATQRALREIYARTGDSAYVHAVARAVGVAVPRLGRG